MIKGTGAALLLAGVFLICRGWILQRREDLRVMGEMAVALDHMAAMIRLKKEPLLQAVSRQQHRRYCGRLFRQLEEEMKGENTLQSSWETVFSAIQPEEAANILCSVDLTGDESQITGGLCLAAGQLREMSAARRALQKQDERLCLTLGGCAAGMAVIVLI